MVKEVTLAARTRAVCMIEAGIFVESCQGYRGTCPYHLTLVAEVQGW